MNIQDYSGDSSLYLMTTKSSTDLIKETYPLYSSLFLTIKEDALSQLLILVPKQLLVLLRWRMIISVKKSTLRNSFPSKSFVSVKLYRVLEAARVLLHLERFPSF